MTCHKAVQNSTLLYRSYEVRLRIELTCRSSRLNIIAAEELLLKNSSRSFIQEQTRNDYARPIAELNGGVQINRGIGASVKRLEYSSTKSTLVGG